MIHFYNPIILKHLNSLLKILSISLIVVIGINWESLK